MERGKDGKDGDGAAENLRMLIAEVNNHFNNFWLDYDDSKWRNDTNEGK